jgi:Glycine/sarcosine/betaine reductase component B subunits.
VELELRSIEVKNIEFGTDTWIKDNTLYICKDGIIKLIKEDIRIKDVEVYLARPGEKVRILPVKDVIQPRAKLNGTAFPGADGPIEEAGTGITYILSGCTVVTTGPIVGFQEGIIDMSGPLTKYTPFSQLNNIVIRIIKPDEIDPHEHEECVRKAGIRAAHYIAKKVTDYPEYTPKRYEWRTISEKINLYPSLPKVVYVYLCMSQGLLHDTYLYGRNIQGTVPTLISPLEVMDGAITSGNCVSPGSKTTTFHHENNAIIEECFKRDGKEINFLGVVLYPLSVTLNEKMINSVTAAKIVEMLNADGAVISMEGFGNPTTDLMMICKRLEEKGIKTVLLSNEDAGVDGKSESLPDGVSCADAIVSTGNSNATLRLPPMETIIGDLKEVERTTGGNADSIQDDGGLIIEIHGIMGSHNLQGYGNLSAVTI